MTNSITCPGKINLFLDVMGKRPNGYHDILTLFLPVHGINDNLSITESTSMSIKCSHPDVPTNETNLCWRAAELFANACELPQRWEISLEKNLPVAGGMGGGSSNAGRLLTLLNQLYPNKISSNKLQQLALQIGADVPFFLNPQAALATGVGEELQNLTPLKEKLSILLVTYQFPISAAYAYKNRSPQFNTSGLSKSDILEKWQKGAIESLIYNDLGIAIQKKFPLIDETLNDLKKYGAVNAIISGSGPTTFGVFLDQTSCQLAKLELIKNGYPEKNLLCVNAG